MCARRPPPAPDGPSPDKSAPAGGEKGASDRPSAATDADAAALFRSAVADALPLARTTARVLPARGGNQAGRLKSATQRRTMARRPRVPTMRQPLRHGDSVESSADDVDSVTLRQLRRGERPPQATLDLHGVTRGHAQRLVAEFVAQQRRGKARCVLIVHGRGVNSEQGIAVLKEALVNWLSTGFLSSQVLAFCSAQPRHGGAGATYLLLRSR